MNIPEICQAARDAGLIPASIAGGLVSAAMSQTLAGLTLPTNSVRSAIPGRYRPFSSG